MDERWLVTGALGCIGAWVVRVLLDEQADVTTFDLAAEGPRLDLVVGPERLGDVRRLAGDLRDLDTVRGVVEKSEATHVVHLAALQVPFCRADPTLGAQVNVTGTVNVFQAAVESGGRVAGLVYASSIAVYDDGTLYGVYKRANEGTAHVYWTEQGLPSLGLRPHTVYGPGRDQGLTSQPTQAMAAAARGEGFHIGFGGSLSMQYAEDVAADFVAAARAVRSGADVVNVGGTLASMGEIVAAVEAVAPDVAGRVTFADEPLPFPEEAPVEDDAFPRRPRTPLADGVRATIERFRATT
jgi:UDP-glucuronate 4-epimerase